MNLTITVAEVCRTARLDPADATDAADAQFVLDNDQAALEASIDPAAWALPGAEHGTIIRRAVVKLLAAEALEMRGRADGASGTFVGAGITISRVPDHAAILRAEANAALALYVRREAAVLGALGFRTSLGRRTVPAGSDVEGSRP
jgi:hypothetical protein